jgi:hypothetical protein
MNNEYSYQPEFQLLRSNAMDLTDKTFNFEQFDADNEMLNSLVNNLTNTFNNINTNTNS